MTTTGAACGSSSSSAAQDCTSTWIGQAHERRNLGEAKGTNLQQGIVLAVQKQVLRFQITIAQPLQAVTSIGVTDILLCLRAEVEPLSLQAEAPGKMTYLQYRGQEANF